MQARQVSAIIVNYNAGELLGRAVSSVLACPQVHHVIVSDNGSRDGSADSLPANPRLAVLRHDCNLGFAAANNRALTTISSKYCLLLNPDGNIDAVTLERMLAFMETHPDVGMCGPRILNEDGSEQRGCRRDEPTPLLALSTLFGKRHAGINKVDAPLPDRPIEVDAISGACMFVRREALDDVGLLDEGYFLHCEDLDWCKRFWQKGWKVMFLPDVTIMHSKGGSSRDRQVRVEWHKHKGMARYYRKFYKDRYPRIMMVAVYTAIWARFLLLAPVWAIRSHLR